MAFPKSPRICLSITGLCIALFLGSGCPSKEKRESGTKGGLSASIESETARLRVHEGRSTEILLRLKNTGKEEWTAKGRNPFYVSYHLLDEKGKALRFENPRTAIPQPVPPGEDVELSLRVKAPLKKGNYLIEVDLVREGLSWFKEAGSRTLVIPLAVEERQRPGETYIASSVPEFNVLQKLIRTTLEEDEICFQGNAGRIDGFSAGAGYPQVWLRDASTIIPASRYFYPLSFLTSWIEEHLAHQKCDGGLEDWVDAEGRTDKNTVETDQEASAIQSAYQVYLLLGPAWLEKSVAGESILDRLDRALSYVFESRFDKERGLIIGAHTADWGDVDPEDPDQQAIYVDEKTHWTADIYDQSMGYEACRRLASMWAAVGERTKADHWLNTAVSLRESANRFLWQQQKGFYRVHIHLDPYPHDFNEDDIFAMGGNTQAIMAGLADAGKAIRIIQNALDHQEAFGISTISGSLLPPYPAGFFKHPAVDEPYEYQNGGQWDWFGGRLVLAMFDNGFGPAAREKLIEIAAKCIRNGGLFEWDTKDGNGRGSDYYAGSAGSLARALIEGYFGFKLSEKGLSLEPKLGEDEGQAHIRIPSSGFTLEMDYHPLRSERKILFRYESNHPGRGEIRWLIPRNFFGLAENDDAGKGLEIRRDGIGVSFSLERRHLDEFAVVETDFKDHTLEMKTRGRTG